MKRLTNLPIPTSLEMIAETCERHAKNCLLNILDCHDCQDCTPAELEIYNRQLLQWRELAQDVRAMIGKKDFTTKGESNDS